MRIAFLSHQWPGARMGGIGAAVRATAAALAGAGHEVHVFTFTLPPDVRCEAPTGIHIHEVADLAETVRQGGLHPPLAAVIQGGGDGVYRLSLGWLLCQALREQHRLRPFDVIEAPEVEALELPLLLDPEFDAPVVTQLHCCTAIAQAGNLTPAGEDGKTLAALEFAAIHLADALCAPTRAVVDATRECCPVRDDVPLIPHPVQCEPNPYHPPPRHGPILFVGRIERLKGVEIIADALNQFLPRHQDTSFRFVGPDTSTAPDGKSMRQWLQSRLSSAIRDRVQFTGELSAQQIATEWRRARFGVMPSLRENFSMACCEAMSAGRTVIVGAGTGSVELIGDAGLAVQRGSAQCLTECMEWLWSNPDKLDDLSRAAFRRVRAVCEPATVAMRRVQFYQGVIDGFGAQRGSRLDRKLVTLPNQCGAALVPALVRMTGLLSGIDATAQKTPGTRLLRIMEQVGRSGGRPAQVLLYGAGKHTARLMSERHVWECRGHRVVGIIDDHPRFAHTPVYLDLPVQSVEGARARVLSGQSLPPIVLSTDTYQEQFWAQSRPLREAGVPVFTLYP